MRFSILVPTRDRAQLAESCARAVLAQRDAPSFELVLVDQSAGDATRDAVARVASEAAPPGVVFVDREASERIAATGGPAPGAGPMPGGTSSTVRAAPPAGDVTPQPAAAAGTPGPTEARRIVRIRSRETGRSRALNAGWPLTRGEWVVIIDDDCEPAPDWLARLDAETRRAGPREVVVGRVMPGPIEPGRAVPPATIVDPRPAEYAGRVDRDLVYPNIALPRRAFDDIGPFDVRMGVGTPLPGGEDNDFGYRLLRAGWRILYRPLPTVFHRAWRSEPERAALKRAYGIGQGAFYAKHLAALDPFIAYRFAHDVLRTTRAAAGAVLRGWTPQARGHLAFLGGLFAGAWRMSVLMVQTGRAPDDGGAASATSVPGAQGSGGPSSDGAATARAATARAATARAMRAGESDARASGAARGLVVEKELTDEGLAPPELGSAAMAYVIFRWNGAPVGRLLVTREDEPTPRAFRSAAFEASAAGILAVAVETLGASSRGTLSSNAAASVPGRGEPMTGPPAPGSPADALKRLAALLDVEEPAPRGARPPVMTAAGAADAADAAYAPAPAREAGQGADPRVLPAASDVSVVIATRDRPEDLAASLAALRALDPPPGEIVVADSASGDPAAVAAVARAAGARLVRLEKPGLSRARNAGAAAASGSVLAFLDDDCRVDPGWLENLRAGFTDDGVEAVTGLLLPLEIETEAQRLFLRYSHMDLRGFLPRRFDRASRPSRYWPIDAWRMGSGGNLAVRATSFARLGGFRGSLGLGTPARGGEDLFLLWSIVRAGGAVVYRPGAMARHRHHRTMEALRQVLFGYGAGHAAYVRAAVASGAPRATVRFYKMSFYADRAMRLVRSAIGRWPVPGGLVLCELRGSFAGGGLGRLAEREAACEAVETERGAAVTTAAKPTS